MSKITSFDAADYLDTPEEIAEFLNEALDTRDATFITKAIGIIARSKGMAEVARKAGVSRESLYRSLGGESNPAFSTVVNVLDALDIQLSVKPKVAA